MRKAQNLSPPFVVALLFMLCLGSLKLRLNIPALYETRSETQLLVIYVNNTLWALACVRCQPSHSISLFFSTQHGRRCRPEIAEGYKIPSRVFAAR